LHHAGGSRALTTKQLHAIAAQLDPDLINQLPASFLPNFKTPCWHRQPLQQQQPTNRLYDKHVDTNSAAAAAAAGTTRPAAAAVGGSEELLQAVKQLQEQERELQCLPYFHILGSFQSGAFSLYSMLEQHPDVAKVCRCTTTCMDYSLLSRR
jgi:hypothetical protein